MTDQFVPIPFRLLVTLSLSQIRKGEFFGIPAEKFYRPDKGSLSTIRFGKLIDTPLGVAAGPHTQLAQNIVAAWLCGARYIELKTIQTLDQLTVSKPCIDMQDEGYNCEWSQELKLEESFSQYLEAWILIHLLHHELGYQGIASGSMVFNMSVGYNMEGILKSNVQRFFFRMGDCHELKALKIREIEDIYPQINHLQIPDRISDNVTLSTMHGCPPEEIEKIGLYLIREKRLHTVVKLNPTLLGASEVRSILNERSGFKTSVPDEAFEHDLRYPDAIRIIKSLQGAAAETGLCFGLKLTNTLESQNFKTTFSPTEKQMYMSGRALHPLAIRLACKLKSDCGENMDISFSAGVDAFNIAEVLAAGLSPVTVCSDLLKPGGYARMHQYLENITKKINDSGFAKLVSFIDAQPDNSLALYAEEVIHSSYYRKSFREPSIKTSRVLMPFDCIHAPCVTTCPTSQDIPGYLYYASKGDFEKAFRVILMTNPFPGVTGAICDHECQTRCTRINYDSPLAIREVKRYISSKLRREGFPEVMSFHSAPEVAVIGAGPSGLSCAWYLRQAGFKVTVYEAGSKAGGMISSVIPDFRIEEKTIQGDLDRIISSGVEIKYNHRVDKQLFDELVSAGQIVYIATGALSAKQLGLPGEDSEEVLDPLVFLEQYKEGKVSSGNSRVVVVGGGNTAMDVARAARRTLALNGTVTLVYRRSREEMPADEEEIIATLAEGVKLIEMSAPVEILQINGRVTGIRCCATVFAGRDERGRRKTILERGAEYIMNADVIIPALGQSLDNPLADPLRLKTKRNGYATQIQGVYIGGDARNGAANIIGAVADGKNAARSISTDARRRFPDLFDSRLRSSEIKDLVLKKSVRQFNAVSAGIDSGQQPVITSDEQAMAEASRCLFCDEICNICVTVCPNLANQGFETEPVELQLKKAVRQEDGSTGIVTDDQFAVNQRYQVFNIGNFCNECGNCTTFCPTSGSPFRDKPTFWLTSESFELAEEGYFIAEEDDELIIVSKNNDGSMMVLRQKEDIYVFDSSVFTVTLDRITFEPVNFVFHDPSVPEAGLHEAARLRTLLDVHKVLPITH